MRTLVHIASAILFQAAAAHGQLTHAIDVRTLPLDRATAGERVELRGVIGFIEAPGTVFVQDDTGGTFFRTKSPLGDLKIGDVVAIKGVTFQGLYLTGIDASEFRVIGSEAPPLPKVATYEDLASGRFHYQRVTVDGIGRGLTALDENRSLLRLALGGRVIEVRVDAPPANMNLVDARLRVTALAAGGINDRRQLVFPYLRVSAWQDVAVTEPAPQVESLPLMTATRLLRFGAPDDAQHRVRMRGVVLASFADGRVFLRGEASDEEPRQNEQAVTAQALAIQLASPMTVTRSAIVDAAGFPRMGGFSAGLADAVILPGAADTAFSATDAPVEVTAKVLLSGSHDADLITLSAQLVDVFRSAAGTELRLQAEGTPLTAHLPVAGAASLMAGSRVRVTGICQIEATSDKGFRSHPDRVRLLLRDAADLVVLQAPAWWTARRLGGAVGVLGALTLLGLLWIAALRRQVASQALALRDRISSEAALEERQRIAREFHDTLEQELAGLSLRLDAAVTRPLEEKARGLLDASRHLVERIQSEARNLVADLRDDTSAAADLVTALENLAAHRAPGAPALVIDAAAPLPPLRSHIIHHLRMIAQESVTNAMKHAAASKVTITLAAEADCLTMSIADDGRGFDPASIAQGQPGHFGCMGIRERCRKIGAAVRWDASATGGAVVTVDLPLREAAQ